MRIKLSGALRCAVFGMCLAVAHAPLSAQAGATSNQAAYDAAQAAFDKGNWEEAATGFRALLPDDTSVRLGHAKAVIASRYAESLIHLDRLEEARGWARRAVDDMPAQDQVSLAWAWQTLGDTQRFAFDYQDAIATYEKAIAIADALKNDDLVYSAGIRLAYAAMTLDPARAVAVLDRILAAPVVATLDKHGLANLEDLRARAAINSGDREGAKRWIRRAIDHSGALTPRVSAAQATVRGDAAIIYRLLGDDEEVRTYLTFTGAGHMEDTDWIGEFGGEWPICEVDGGLRPDDSAVVQFVLNEDGSVDGAFPIYASRPGLVGKTFAEAVSQWRWNPAKLKTVDAFWLSTLRLELRCVTRPAPEALAKPYNSEVRAWMVGRRLIGEQNGISFQERPMFWPETSNVELVRLFGSQASSVGGRVVLFERGKSLLDEARAPASAYAVLAFNLAKRHGTGSSLNASHRMTAEALGRFVVDLRSRFPAEKSIAWLMLEYALTLEGSGDFKTAKPLLDAVLATPEATLPATDPVRRVALLHDALVRVKLGDDAGATERLESSGLTAAQCTLFDTRPIPASTSVASSQFPAEALRWRFEGYVKTAYDIADDGSVDNVRAILAYPPFIFSRSTEEAVKSFRYVAPRIAGKAMGCTGETTGVSYRVPK